MSKLIAIASLIALALLSATLARAGDARCNAAPYAMNDAHAEKYYALVGALVLQETSHQTPAQTTALLRHLEDAAQRACRVRFDASGIDAFLALGLPAQFIESASIESLAVVYLARSGEMPDSALSRQAPVTVAAPDQNTRSAPRLYAIAQCYTVPNDGSTYCSVWRRTNSLDKPFSTPLDCQRFIERYLGVGGSPIGGRFMIAPGNWYECLSRPDNRWRP